MAAVVQFGSPLCLSLDLSPLRTEETRNDVLLLAQQAQVVKMPQQPSCGALAHQLHRWELHAGSVLTE